MVPKQTGSGPDVGRMWAGCGSEMDWKWSQNGPEIDRKWTRTYTLVDLSPHPSVLGAGVKISISYNSRFLAIFMLISSNIETCNQTRKCSTIVTLN